VERYVQRYTCSARGRGEGGGLLPPPG